MQNIESTTEAQALAALVDAQLEEVVCGGWSRLSWERIVPDVPVGEVAG